MYLLNGSAKIRIRNEEYQLTNGGIDKRELAKDKAEIDIQVDIVRELIFTINYLLDIRDKVLKNNVPGAIKSSYMSTEKRFYQTFNVLEHNGNYASEMRGLWRVENDFMGGPYVSLAELDATNQRVVVAFGYVYAPSKDKRNLLRQVEAMIYSLEMNEQPKNDKINSQIKMGN